MPTPPPSNPDWLTLGMGLVGGLALFLFGLDQVSSGLKQAAGDTLKTLLTRLTTNRFLGAFTGAAVTGVLNSSSVTTVLVVGFVTAGVMSLIWNDLSTSSFYAKGPPSRFVRCGPGVGRGSCIDG
jgi:O-antigen/teichoic acid export membrane protein